MFDGSYEDYMVYFFRPIIWEKEGRGKPNYLAMS